MIWLWFAAIYLAVVLLIDWVVRRKKWEQNTKDEQKSLITTGVCAFPFVFCPAVGLFAGAVKSDHANAILRFISDSLVLLGSLLWAVCLAATAAGLVLRAMGKSTASFYVQIAGLACCAIMVLGVFFL